MTKSAFDERQIITPEGHEAEYQSIAFTASSVPATNAILSDQVLLFSTEDCHFRFDVSGSSALVTDTFLPAGLLVLWQITNGKFISAIRNSASGTLHISPVR